MRIPFSKNLIDKLKKDNSLNEVADYINKIGKFSTVVYYITDSDFRRSINLKNWIKAQVNNPIIQQVASECLVDDEVATVKNVLRYWADSRYYWYGHLKYEGDKQNYGKSEYWGTVEEILEKGKDDCDGFMTLMFLTLLACGIPEERLYCVGGSVNGGGHAYVVWTNPDDMLEYPIDGCYWHKASLSMTTSYDNREAYLKGTGEWFRFNTQGSYKLRK